MAGEFANAYVGPPYDTAEVMLDKEAARNDDTVQAARHVGAGKHLLGDLLKGKSEGSKTRVNSAWFDLIAMHLNTLRYLSSAGIKRILLTVEGREEEINVEEDIGNIHISRPLAQ